MSILNNREQCHTISPGVATYDTQLCFQSVLGHWSLFIGSGETCVKRRSKEAVWELESIIHSYNTTQQETVNAVLSQMSHTISW